MAVSFFTEGTTPRRTDPRWKVLVKILGATLDLGGGGGGSLLGITTTSTNYNLTSSNYTLLVNATAAPRTVNLPSAAANPGRVFNIKKIDATGNNVTIDGAGGDTIDGDLTLILNVPETSVTLQSDGVSNWAIL